jgi:hypothetical protein
MLLQKFASLNHSLEMQLRSIQSAAELGATHLSAISL